MFTGSYNALLTTHALTTYARHLGLFSATMAVIGGIIGGGIFRTPASVAERTGSGGLALTAWVLGGGIALFGAFCFGELGARRPPTRRICGSCRRPGSRRAPRRRLMRCACRQLGGGESEKRADRQRAHPAWGAGLLAAQESRG
ncbi:MAG: amino acid permease [Gemmatimonadales bacterium]